MPTLTVKNIPDDLYQQLKRRAAVHRRSLNSEIIVLLEQALRPRPVDPEEVIAQARALREKTAAYPITDAELQAAKVAGRA